MRNAFYILIFMGILACGKSVKQRDALFNQNDHTETITSDAVSVAPAPEPNTDDDALQKQCEELGNTWLENQCLASKPANLNPIFVTKPILDYAFSKPLADSVVLRAMGRDFKSSHPDFEKFAGTGATLGLVDSTLGADGNPVFTGNPGEMITSAKTFFQWYNDVPNVNTAHNFDLTLSRVPGTNIYGFESPEFFPLDNVGFGNEQKDHNFSFTVRLATTFTYVGGEVFSFRGDDDVWVFINNKLAVDIGGVHHSAVGQVSVDSLGLIKGKDYPFVMFFAERRAGYSRFKVETSLKFNQNSTYIYAAQAVDPEGQAIRYSLVKKADPSMTINETTGVVEWPSKAIALGKHEISIKAEDGAGGQAIQDYVLNVAIPK